MIAPGRAAFSSAALFAAVAGLFGCTDGQVKSNLQAASDGNCVTAACYAPVDPSTTTGSTTEGTTETTESMTTGPGMCGNGVVDVGEDCDDGTDCADGVCNSDAYTGVKHCNADCSGLYTAWCGDGQAQGEESCDAAGDAAMCDADCTAVECGDGHVNAAADEQCDDGRENKDGYDDRPPDEVACNTMCTGKAPHCGDAVCQEADEDSACGDCVCGDGIVSGPAEACDEGMDGVPVDSMDCDADCSAVECGDGYTNTAAGEECDDGNKVDDDACGNDCKTCGDGVPQAGEDCDDGNKVDDDDCSNDCVAPRIVFVTNAMHNGKFEGLAGADAMCSAAGVTANPRVPAMAWRAWLSDDTGSPSTRFDTAFTGWYRRVDGTPVAKGWADLTDGTLAAPIIVTESGEAPIEPMIVWSNTMAGEKIGSDHCQNWGNPLPLPKGRVGDATAVNGDWTDSSDDAINPFGCSGSYHLYCFEQQS